LASRIATRSTRTTIPGSITGWTRAYRFSLRRCPANLCAPLCASSRRIGLLKNGNRASAQTAPPARTPRKKRKGQHAWCWSTLSALGHFVEGMPFEEAEIGARKRRGNQDRALTTDSGRFNVPRARLAPAMISTPGHWASRRRQRGALPAWSSTDCYWARCLLARIGVLLTWGRRISLVAQTSYCQRFLVG
jgi:hypothetical protein